MDRESDISSSNDIQEEQIKFWLKQPILPVSAYKEPELEESTVEIIKLVCDVLKQTDEVFITSVNVTEEYIYSKSNQNVELEDSLLTVVCAVLITSKLIGSHPEVKIASLQTIIRKLNKREVHQNIIKNLELDIILTLGRVPLNTMATDLSMFLECYVKNLKLRVDIYPLCLEILNIVYICRKKVFSQIKSVYMQTADALQVFHHLIRNKMYFPSGITLCALRITRFKNFLDLKKVSKDMEQISSIHSDHLQLLGGIIFDLIEV